MKIEYFTVQGNDCFYEISNLLEVEIKKSFKTTIPDGAIFFMEDYSLMNNSNLLTVVRIQKIKGSENNCEIEIVSGGGGEGVFSLTFGNEKRRLNKIADLVEGFCRSQKYVVSDFISK